MVSRAVKLYGTDAVDPPMRTVGAGTLSVEFNNGALRYVRIGDREVIRGIAFLVRDENWGTFAPKIEDLAIEESVDAFSISYRGTCADAQRTLTYDARIDGRSDGSLSFEVAAQPQTDVVTNRAGFTVLHPIEGVAGNAVKVLHVDGSEEESTFPETIDPMCPFQDIRALSHEIAPGTWVTCTMEGDAYEMEDQRNWSDASYKTYIRPLSKPRPYILAKGEPIAQSVRLSVSGPLPRSSTTAGSGRTVTIGIGETIGRLPEIGIGVPAGEIDHVLDNARLLKRMAPRWLACQVDLRHGHGKKELANYRALGEAIGADIVLEVVTKGGMDPVGELAALAAAAEDAGIAPEAVSVFPAQDLKSVLPGGSWPEMPTFEETYAATRKAFANARLGGGMATYFTELNRKRPPAGPIDYVTNTTCPNVHASDDRSVMETLEALPYQILSTRAFMGNDMSMRIGPSQLGCRENPYGSSTAANPDNGRVSLSRVDPRQRGLFNAAWSLAYIAVYATGGVEAVALGAPTGAFGHIYRRTDFPQPNFDELSGPAVYPSFHVLSDLAHQSGASLLSTAISDTGTLGALATRSPAGTSLWLANLTPDEIHVTLPSETSGEKVVVLDVETFDRLTIEPDFLDTAARTLDGRSLSLDAYACARIELP